MLIDGIVMFLINSHFNSVANQEKKRTARRSQLDHMLFQPNFSQAKKRKRDCSQSGLKSLGSQYHTCLGQLMLFRTEVSQIAYPV